MPPTAANKLSTRRIMAIDVALADELNRLFDAGTVWEHDQGTLFLGNNDNALFVAAWEGQLVGFITAYRLQRFDRRKAQVLLYEVGVLAEFRERGIGKALVKTVLHWAKEVGADEVWVLTNSANQAAKALYQSMGGIEDSPGTTMFVFKG